MPAEIPQCKPCKDGKDGKDGRDGKDGKDGVCICPKKPELKNVHFDDNISAIYQGQTYLLPANNDYPFIGCSVPGKKFNDEVIYYPYLKVMVYIDYNHSSGIPHVIVFERKGEVTWEKINGIGIQLLSYWGNENGHLHHCIQSLDRAIQRARDNNKIYRDWTPITNFQTNGSLPKFE